MKTTLTAPAARPKKNSIAIIAKTHGITPERVTELIAEEAAKRAGEIRLTERQSATIDRLAWQFSIPRATVIDRIITDGLREADQMAGECGDPFPEYMPDFDPSKEMDTMTREQIAAMQKGGECAQQVLYKRYCNGLKREVAKVKACG